MMPASKRQPAISEDSFPHAVSEHALMVRINRQTRKKGQFLRKTRNSSPLRKSLGTYYLVDSYKRYIDGTDDLAELANRYGALEAGEFVAAS